MNMKITKEFTWPDVSIVIYCRNLLDVILDDGWHLENVNVIYGDAPRPLQRIDETEVTFRATYEISSDPYRAVSIDIKTRFALKPFGLRHGNQNFGPCPDALMEVTSSTKACATVILESCGRITVKKNTFRRLHSCGNGLN